MLTALLESETAMLEAMPTELDVAEWGDIVGEAADTDKESLDSSKTSTIIPDIEGVGEEVEVEVTVMVVVKPSVALLEREALVFVVLFEEEPELVSAESISISSASGLNTNVTGVMEDDSDWLLDSPELTVASSALTGSSSSVSGSSSDSTACALGSELQLSGFTCPELGSWQKYWHESS